MKKIINEGSNLTIINDGSFEWAVNTQELQARLELLGWKFRLTGWSESEAEVTEPASEDAYNDLCQSGLKVYAGEGSAVEIDDALRDRSSHFIYHPQLGKNKWTLALFTPEDAAAAARLGQ